MPALNFQRRFARLVERGLKRSTIRAYRLDRRDSKPGDRLFLFTGQRTTSSRRLVARIGRGRIPVPGFALGHVVRCKSVHPIELREERGTVERAAGHVELKTVVHVALGSPCGIDRLAKLEGFRSGEDMFEWFRKTHGLPFKGLLIRW